MSETIEQIAGGLSYHQRKALRRRVRGKTMRRRDMDELAALGLLAVGRGYAPELTDVGNAVATLIDGPPQAQADSHNKG